jgi:hypothetical protein
MMREQSGDALLFQRAKAKRQAALAELERLEWAEKHQLELEAQAALQEKRAQLDDAQERARAAKQRGAMLTQQLEPMVKQLAELARELKATNAEIERGMHYESFGLRDGMIDKPTVMPGLGIKTELAILAMRVARELVRLSGTDAGTAELKASQRSL